MSTDAPDPRVTGVPSVPGTIALLAACYRVLCELTSTTDPDAIGTHLVLYLGDPDLLGLPGEVAANLKAWGWPWEETS